MVRMSKASRQRVVDHQYNSKHQHNKLINRHFLNLILLAVIFVAVGFYFYFLHIERENEVTSSQQRQKEEHSTSNHLKAVDHNNKDRLEPLAAAGAALAKEKGGGNNEPENEMMAPFLTLPASRVLSAGLPFLVYGTAWKKHETSRLVSEAVHAGFRFIDTACQPKHYNEPGVGQGWTNAARELGLTRTDLFLQTKFTSIPGQDPNDIPYDATAPLEAQVAESLQVSLKNLQTTYLDSWVMHSPMPTMEETMTVYRVMEGAVDDGKVLRLGISNCHDYKEFTTIYEMARIKPAVLQNRFYGDANWDQDLREFCRRNNIWYQSFWTLTANRHALATTEAQEWAARKGLTPQTLLYAYLMSLGYGTPLDGTTNQKHMAEDIAVMERLQRKEAIFESGELRRFEHLLGF